MSGLDESGIILSAMLEAEKEIVDPAVALLVAEDISETLRKEEKENNEIWKEKIAARKAVVNRAILYDSPPSYIWADTSTTCAKHYYYYDMSATFNWDSE